MEGIQRSLKATSLKQAAAEIEVYRDECVRLRTLLDTKF